jgi:NAD(P)H-dependent flavin oxidoreductase YrpB (nitropropane dioxygenase family)
MARTILRTELCERLGIEYPVLLAGMGPVAGGGEGVATRDLVAAVSNAGGLGVLGAVSLPPDRLREEIRAVRELTDKPFGVDLLLSDNFLMPNPGGIDTMYRREAVPAQAVDALKRLLAELEIEWQEDPEPPPPLWVPKGKSWAGSQMEVVLEENVPVFASGLGSPAPFVEQLEANGTVILSLVGNVRAARRVADGGAHVVVAQGTEAGGHTGKIGTLALLPQVMDAVAPKPVVAAGGIADGRALAGVLAMGCVGAWCGTAFLVSEEANQPALQQRRILDAEAEDTSVTRLYSGKTMRNIGNPLIEAWERAGMQALPMGLQTILTRDLVYSLHQAGREDLLMNAAGQTSGMMSEIRPAAAILRDMVDGGAEILARQLPERVRAEPGD